MSRQTISLNESLGWLMDIREFLDELYSLYAKTTGAENMYWMPEEDVDRYAGGPNTYNIFAVGENETKHDIAFDFRENDANFITAIHGALPDLVRRTHEALDEADRLDEQRDEQEIRIAQLEGTIDEKNRDIEYIQSLRTAELAEMGKQIQKTLKLIAEKDELLEEINTLEDQVAQLNWELSKERGE